MSSLGVSCRNSTVYLCNIKMCDYYYTVDKCVPTTVVTKKLLNFSWMIRKNFLDKYDKTEFGRKLCICSARALIFHRIVKQILNSRVLLHS